MWHWKPEKTEVGIALWIDKIVKEKPMRSQKCAVGWRNR